MGAANAVFIVEQATVYRAGGRRWFTRRAAIKAYAAAKFRAKHPCECEQGDYASGYPGYTCHVHDARDAVMPRYLRVLRRRLEAAPVRSETRPQRRRKEETKDEDDQARGDTTG